MFATDPSRPAPSEPPFFLRESRRVRAGQSPATPARHGPPLSDTAHDILLDDDALMRAARHRAEVTLAHTRGLQKGERKGQAQAQRVSFWAGLALGACVGGTLVFLQLTGGLTP